MNKGGTMMKKMWKNFMVVLLAGILAIMPVTSAEAANKAARIRVSFNGKKGEKAIEKNMYGVSAGFKKTNTMKKNMKVSSKVYVPKSAIKKNGDQVHLDVALTAVDFKKGGKKDLLSFTVGKYTVLLCKERGKVKLKKIAGNGKVTSAGKYASFKKSGKYYVVSLKNIPMNNTMSAFDEDCSEVAMDTKKAHTLAVDVSVTGLCSKTKGYVYVDDITVKAKKTQKIKFNTKDYRPETRGVNAKLKITTIK